MLRDRRHVETQAATGDLVRTSDRAQIELGEGPCLDALWEQRTYRVNDMGAEPRWRQYGPYARELGIESMLGFQLFTVDKTLGALDLYSGDKHAFDDWSEELGWVFASYTAVALAWAEHSEQMREAVSTRQEIGEALGILMERYGLASQDAFEVLRRGVAGAQRRAPRRGPAREWERARPLRRCQRPEVGPGTADVERHSAPRRPPTPRTPGGPAVSSVPA